MNDHSRPRLSTGVPGLDDVLDGGLLQRGVYIVQGTPGAGKTILANQVAFHHAAGGGQVLYVTLLAETNERMLFNLEQLAFFDLSRIPAQISYVSAFVTFEESGLKGLVALLRSEMRARNVSLLVVDGLVAAAEHASSAKELKRFIHELQIQANLLACTVLLLSSGAHQLLGPEHTMVDGVIEVSDRRVGRRAERELEVKKFRGSGTLRGGHAFEITPEGIVLYARLEAVLGNPDPGDRVRTERVTTGLADLDRALSGGLRSASSTVLFGATGTGKTTLGLHFLAAASEAAPALLFGFYETPQRALEKGDALGLPLREKHERGLVHFVWHPPTERVLDALGHRLLDVVRTHGIKRLFVDGLDGFFKAAAYPERVSAFMSALTNELRLRGVTTLYTSELMELISPEVTLPMSGMSSLVENVVLLRFAERQQRVVRTLSIMKTRDSEYDARIHELHIETRATALRALPEPRGSSPLGTALEQLLRTRGGTP